MVVDHEHVQRARTLAPSAVVLWGTPTEALVSVESKPDRDRLVKTDNWTLSGLVRFEDYGLQFYGASEPPIFYSELDTTIDVEQLVCHTLVKSTDSRRTSYALLLLAAAEFDEARLRTTAAAYELTDLIDDMLSFLRGESTDSKYIPSPRDFKALKHQYEVSL